MCIRTIETANKQTRALMMQGQRAQAKYRREELARKNGRKNGTRGVSFTFPHGGEDKTKSEE